MCDTACDATAPTLQTVQAMFLKAAESIFAMPVSCSLLLLCAQRFDAVFSVISLPFALFVGAVYATPHHAAAAIAAEPVPLVHAA